jgi:site-specific DNA-methyltransferase (adenine-specific)
MDVLSSFDDEVIDLVYIDPPFGTGSCQRMNRRKNGEIISEMSYSDTVTGYIDVLRAHVGELMRILKPTGMLYLHLDRHNVHRAKVMCDDLIGEQNFINEIIWSYNFGGRGKDRFAPKHDNILAYAKDANQHIFNLDEVDRIPYVAPEMQYVGRERDEAEKRIALGQVPTDVWDIPIIGTASKERTGYPTQKPLKLASRIITASSPKGGIVLDCFAGSGTTGAAAHKNDRQFVLVDDNKQSIDVMKKRFEGIEVEWL